MFLSCHVFLKIKYIEHITKHIDIRMINTLKYIQNKVWFALRTIGKYGKHNNTKQWDNINIWCLWSPNIRQIPNNSNKQHYIIMLMFCSVSYWFSYTSSKRVVLCRIVVHHIPWHLNLQIDFVFLGRNMNDNPSKLGDLYLSML